MSRVKELSQCLHRGGVGWVEGGECVPASGYKAPGHVGHFRRLNPRDCVECQSWGDAGGAAAPAAKDT